MNNNNNQNIYPSSELEHISLTALVPGEMVKAQQRLIAWCLMKEKVVAEEVDEMQQAYESAKEKKWSWKPLYKQWHRNVKRLEYYQKVRAALEAGFYIVPNFPIDLFAIRTGKKVNTNYIGHFSYDHEQTHQELTVGEGEYKNPFPLVDRFKAQISDGKTIRASYSHAVDWADIEFPIAMAKPNIMEATDRAMALKIFDRIGIMPHTRKEDPCIIGQVLRREGSSLKICSFMIAWYLDTRMI